MADHKRPKNEEVYPETRAGLRKRRAHAEHKRYLIALYWKRGVKNQRIIGERLKEEHSLKADQSTISKDIEQIRELWRQGAV